MSSLALRILPFLTRVSQSEEGIELGPPPEDGDSWFHESYYWPTATNAQAPWASGQSSASARDGLHVRVGERPRKKWYKLLKCYRLYRYLLPSEEPVDHSSTHFGAAILQWRSGVPSTWYRLEGYDFLDAYGSSPQRDLKDYIGWPRGGLARTVRELRLEDKGLGQVNAVILCETYAVEAYFNFCGVKLSLHSTAEARDLKVPLPPSKRFSAELKRLDESYSPLRTTQNLGQIFLLQVHHAHLNQVTEFLEKFATKYAERRKRLIYPLESKLRQWNLKAIIADSHLYQQFAKVGQGLVLATESLLDVVAALQGEQGKGDLALLDAELRGCCKDMTRLLNRLSNDLDHHLKLLSLARDISQSNNVRVLTLLATIFLPLSLSAGILSMQTRFQDLGDKLYDFFGVVVLLVTVVLLILIVMFVLSYASEVESMFQRSRLYKIFGRRLLFAAVAIIALPYGALILTSFLVGMFKDVVLGAKILGYGTAVAVGMPIVAASLYFMPKLLAIIVQRCRHCWKPSKPKRRGKDPERTAGQKAPRSPEKGPVLAGDGDLGDRKDPEGVVLPKILEENAED